MPLTLIPLPPEKFSSWLGRSTSEYITDLIATDIPEEQATENAQRTMTRSFPEGQATLTNAVFTLADEVLGDVGYLWVGQDTSGDPTSWWVWDIVVEAEHRGHGFGRQAMILAEDYARSHGGQTLGLNVFGFNKTARGLYESLGYETTSIKMRKTL
ncbi:GNAT family N-acetyltransferase [Arthrobacter sp. NIO-1057]|uniref:GNAT family N-acetyltransferase n=1 Tax=Arthrobacter sp. NIO-1057 TaxID=993071 RepID=UPI00071E2EBC|nr:GNAT family N-acetyltransferase [Arthrobacter sp. NIO-1057]KSU64869.1 GNAT family acetyltransferase [Arthrobacter sp. NIO-1057]SCC48954.1 Ribosomal protein S18 acetylase RimI [Arthrobacter sp. NIO-1057]